MAKIFLLSLFFLLSSISLSNAQTPPPSLEPIDLRTAEFRWDYDVNEPVTEFRVKCGSTRGGPYTLVAPLPNALARSFPMRGVITIQGQYACVVTALNKTLESPPSNEIFFSAEASALTPNNFRIEKGKP